MGKAGPNGAGKVGPDRHDAFGILGNRDTEPPDAHFSRRRVDIGQQWHGGDRHLVAAPLDGERDPLSGTQAHEIDDVFKGGDWTSIHAFAHAPRPEAGGLGRAAGYDAADPRGYDQVADEIAEAGEN